MPLPPSPVPLTPGKVVNTPSVCVAQDDKWKLSLSLSLTHSHTCTTRRSGISLLLFMCWLPENLDRSDPPHSL